jgi:hypothetical protein
MKLKLRDNGGFLLYNLKSKEFGELLYFKTNLANKAHPDPAKQYEKNKILYAIIDCKGVDYISTPPISYKEFKVILDNLNDSTIHKIYDYKDYPSGEKLYDAIIDKSHLKKYYTKSWFIGRYTSWKRMLDHHLG